MKKNIHPKKFDIVVTCSCSNKFNIKSTISNDFNIDVCYKCHSFYTGKIKFIDNIGRIGKFNKKYKNLF
ncbi:50S ribosomal protein L31 [endosymbiont of Euscepes postfasciatus]|uniref:50S ribosomal protein L31 n=1 Tax=endosymbiont of Euscepes postfasciatus TaxID=650377 RepID=UPI000DC6D8F1|nr:50S ribosomal protein L31 [endosymbiont of Euscepes postfasciatus]BBA84581.1 50S ribosomal protein L31 [endosymbiont of Euscepes postfasciatus]